MISIIICSKYRTINPIVKNNIKDTIGSIPFEIIWIDNSSNKYSIFSAYNEGVSLAKYEMLCFMHEDIIFHSDNWGLVVKQYLDNIKLGVLGVVGTYYIDQYTMTWISSGIIGGNLIQYNSLSKKSKLYHHNDYKYLKNNILSVDGLWMCMRKSLFVRDGMHWDDTLYKGFHFYDMDICLQALSKGYINFIAPEILIEHKSNGNKNSVFYDNCLLFHRKWDSLLPKFIQSLPEDIKIQAEYNQLIGFCQQGLALQHSKKELYKFPHKVLTSLLNHCKKNK